MICFGVDLAWQGERNHSAVAVGELVSDQLAITALSSEFYSVDQVLDFLGSAIPTEPNAVVAIDAPLILENEAGSRPCEEITSRFGRFHAGAYPSNRTLYPGADSVRLAKELAIRGFRMDARPY